MNTQIRTNFWTHHQMWWNTAEHIRGNI